MFQGYSLERREDLEGLPDELPEWGHCLTFRDYVGAPVERSYRSVWNFFDRVGFS